MSMHRSAGLHGTRCGLLLLAGLLALGGRSAAAQDAPAAQAGDTVPLNLVFVVFPDEGGAGQAMTDMTTAQRGSLESYAVVSKDEQGNVKVHQKHDKEGGSATTQRASQSIDGVVALLGRAPQEPQGDSAAGYAPGAAPGKQAGISDEDMGQIQAALTPSSSAIILVVEAPDAAAMESAMRDANAQKVITADVAPPQ